MTIKQGFRDAFESVPSDLSEDVRSSLLALSDELYKAEHSEHPLLATWARRFWLDAFLALGPNSIWNLLKDVSEFLECPAILEHSNPDYQTALYLAGQTLQQALFAFVDHVREHTLR